MLVAIPVGFGVAGALCAFLRGGAAAAVLTSCFDSGWWWW